MLHEIAIISSPTSHETSLKFEGRIREYDSFLSLIKQGECSIKLGKGL